MDYERAADTRDTGLLAREMHKEMRGKKKVGVRGRTRALAYCFCTGLEGLAEQLQFAETGVDVSSLPESRRTNLIPKPYWRSTVHKSEWRTPPRVGLVKTCLLAFYYAFYYAILFFTTLFTTLREAPANDLYVFWHVPNRQYGFSATSCS